MLLQQELGSHPIVVLWGPQPAIAQGFSPSDGFDPHLPAGSAGQHWYTLAPLVPTQSRRCREVGPVCPPSFQFVLN